MSAAGRAEAAPELPPSQLCWEHSRGGVADGLMAVVGRFHFHLLDADPPQSSGKQSNGESSRKLCGLLTTKPGFSKRARREKMYLMKQCQDQAQKANMETMCRDRRFQDNWAHSLLSFKNTEHWGPNLAIRGGSGPGREGRQAFAKTVRSSHSLNPQRAGPTLSSRVMCAAFSMARGEPEGAGSVKD